MGEHTLRLPLTTRGGWTGTTTRCIPSAVSRRVLICPDRDRVRGSCEGGLVTDHDRIWAPRHQAISDPGHVKAAHRLHQQRFALVPPTAQTAHAHLVASVSLSLVLAPALAGPQETARERLGR